VGFFTPSGGIVSPQVQHGEPVSYDCGKSTNKLAVADLADEYMSVIVNFSYR
jgi:hypothetical protein